MCECVSVCVWEGGSGGYSDLSGGAAMRGVRNGFNFHGFTECDCRTWGKNNSVRFWEVGRNTGKK